MLEMLSKERARNGRGSMTWILKHCVVPEKRRSPEVNLFRSVKYPYRFRERDSVIDGEPAALLYPCIQVLFEDSDSLLTMLLLSQAAYSLCPYPRKTKTGWMMQERSYETFRALQQKNAFPSYLSCPIH